MKIHFRFSDMTHSNMGHRLLINWIFVVLLLMVCVTQATFIQNIYNKTELGQNISGTVIIELPFKSNQECSVRLLKSSDFL